MGVKRLGPRIRYDVCLADETREEVPAIDRTLALLRYLWTYLVVRLGPLWWGVATVVGALAAAGCLAVGRARGRHVRPGRAASFGILASYVAVVLSGTLVVRPRASVRVLRPNVIARLWRVFGQGHALDPEPLANMLMFVPVGILLPAALGWSARRTLLASLALSVCVEAAQYLLVRGECDPGDVVLNVAGALAGYGVWWLARRVHERATRLSHTGRRPRHMRVS